MTERRFTIEEANEAIPRVAEAIERIRESRQVVFRSGERVRRRASTNGGGPEGAALLEALATLRRDMEALTEEGVILRDAETGLVDFPAERDGTEVFLCWRLGEDRVAFWHGPESGFAGRRPLD